MIAGRPGPTEDAAVAYDRDYRFPARGSGGSPGEITEASIAPARTYLIRVSIIGNTGHARRHHHYYPPDTDSSGDGPTLFVEIHGGRRHSPSRVVLIQSRTASPGEYYVSGE